MAQKVVIIGGGVIGSAVAYFLLANEPGLSVTVLERDPSYARSSSALSGSGIRQQFSTAVAVQMSGFGLEFLRSMPELLDVNGSKPTASLHEGGYLFLAGRQGADVLRENCAMQNSLGANIAFLDCKGLVERFPWLNVDDLEAGSYGVSGEGWFDSYGVLQALRKKAQALGARYFPLEVVAVRRQARRATGVATSSGEEFECDTLVNAAGPWARNIAAMLDIDLPVHARRRSIFNVSSPAVLERAPLLIDPTGVWFRPEGNGYLCGIAPKPENDHDDLPLHEVDHALFDEIVWPKLAERVPQFEALRVESCWSGYYEYNVFDQNAIIGYHPDVENCVFANGFSGHGLQHGPATGRAVSELIRNGRYTTLDVSSLGWSRVLENQPIVEKNVV
ncbi:MULTISPECIES: NAD(P)/FAD-dependent oxidoreductase [Paraburkholderia]|uniref:Sarcosine oxidase n=1 Tax=Paraburkholderia phenazinium TaxID=60549 RepID=A0A1N6JF44_9BURK|nr:FAD-binding oxidoreductase [Paraburkholderia phenazinium]SIO42915.1 sarcosine oxidase [Paraburkholderia phenazinium]SIO49716.1 sarcosine oxidase [Paraburkholderia phenazinium]